jgi:hypothetical protein
VVLYDRITDPGELTNLAYQEPNRQLLADLLSKLEALITAEIGEDTRAWVTEKPQLLGWPSWKGDSAA